MTVTTIESLLDSKNPSSLKGLNKTLDIILSYSRNYFKSSSLNRVLLTNSIIDQLDTFPSGDEKLICLRGSYHHVIRVPKWKANILLKYNQYLSITTKKVYKRYRLENERLAKCPPKKHELILPLSEVEESEIIWLGKSEDKKNLFWINGYWKDDKSEFERELVYAFDGDFKYGFESGVITSEDVFHFGMDEGAIIREINNPGEKLDFVITSYQNFV
jgi:hypothetical protein